jgi:low affinity Fe/Cu permease
VKLQPHVAVAVVIVVVVVVECLRDVGFSGVWELSLNIASL